MVNWFLFFLCGLFFFFFFENSSFFFRDKSFFQPSPGMVNWFLFFLCGLFSFFVLVEIFFNFCFFGVRTRKSELLQKYILFVGHHKNTFVWLLDAKFGGI